MSPVRRFLESYTGQLVLVLLLFTACRMVTMDVFFHGFLLFFDLLNGHVFPQVSAPVLFSQNPYHSWSIVFSAFLDPWFSVTVVLLYLPILLKWKTFSVKGNYKWQERLLVYTAAFIVVWELSTYQYNYYLNNAFYTDRIVLVVLFLLLLRYRVFVPLFIAFVFVYRSQFNYPVDGFPLLDIWLVFDVLIAYMAYMYAQLVVPTLKVPFTYVALCIVGATYFYSGVKKIMISPHGYEWLVNNNPAYLFLNMHLLGWMANASDTTISKLFNFLSAYKVPLQLLVLLIELAGLLLLRARKLSIVLLSLCICLHLGIFIMGSTIFWKWILVEVALIVVLLRDKNVNEYLFSKRAFISSLIIIVSSPLWLQPNMYGWHDTPMNQYFSFEVTDDKGNTYPIAKNDMNPYHQWFQFNTFHFLLREPCLRISPFGFTQQYKLAKAIQDAGPGDYKTLLSTYGKNVYDETKTNKFNEFIRTYFRNRNRRIGERFMPFMLHTPYHLYNSVPVIAYRDEAPVKTFRVVYHVTYIQNGQVLTIANKIIDEVDIGF